MRRGGMFRRVLIWAAVPATICAGPAQAGTLTAGPGGTKIFSEPEGLVTQNSIFVGDSGGPFIQDSAASMTVAPGSGCGGEGTTVAAGTVVLCPGATSFTLLLGGGNDVLNAPAIAPCPCFATFPLLIDGGAGGDALFGGGSSGDFVTYETRSEGVSVDLGAGGGGDGSSLDGAPGSRDALDAATIEGVIGTPAADLLEAGPTAATLLGEGGNDELLGGAGGDLLEGGGENDTLNGRGGSDVVRGDVGVDSIEARDGVADDIDCGPDEDAALTDAIDTRANCDPPATPTNPAPLPTGPGATVPSDTSAPDTRITQKPPNRTTKRRARYGFSSTETGSTFECKLDRRPFRACGPRASFGGLKPGPHRLRVRAVDAAGNVDASPASHRFRVLD